MIGCWRVARVSSMEGFAVKAAGCRLRTSGRRRVPPEACGPEPGASFRDLRIRVPERRQVRRPRPRVDLLEEAVVARLGLQLVHATCGLVQVAEDNGLRRAHLLAGRHD